jgi:hypothetical protein
VVVELSVLRKSALVVTIGGLGLEKLMAMAKREGLSTDRATGLGAPAVASWSSDAAGPQRRRKNIKCLPRLARSSACGNRRRRTAGKHNKEVI